MGLSQRKRSGSRESIPGFGQSAESIAVDFFGELIMLAGIDLSVPSGSGIFLFPLFFIMGTIVFGSFARSSVTKISDIQGDTSKSSAGADSHIAAMILACIFSSTCFVLSLITVYRIFDKMYL